MKKETYFQRPYPVDSRGFPLEPHVVNERLFTPDPDPRIERINNHHRNFYRRQFGRFVISQTFRDLESQQTLMYVPEHTVLHQMYGGIKIPPVRHMIDEIDTQRLTNGQLKIFNKAISEYEYFPIDDEKWSEVLTEYDALGTRKTA